MDFAPYKSNEILENKYYQIPQELFENERYKNKLNYVGKIQHEEFSEQKNLQLQNCKIYRESILIISFIT